MGLPAEEHGDAAELFFIYERPTATGGAKWRSKAAPGGPIEFIIYLDQGAAWGAATPGGDGGPRKALAAHGGRQAP